LVNFAFFWQSLKGRYHGNQQKSKNWHFSRKIFFVTMPFQNRLEYRNGDGQLKSELNVATWCANMLMIGGVTPEKRLLILVLL